ncbi:MAG: carbohydrate binding family 9 domain-containing protein [Sphingobacteriaceae bacterium]|nr:carbohydrate binding family 9 domain-containing protein [Sphingobacteriaceae bacterium]
MKKLVLILFMLSGIKISFSQTANKSIAALRITQAPKIDGELNDSCWMYAEIAGDLIQNQLSPGAPSYKKTEVKITYDDDAIYIGALLHDESDSILGELSTRDNEANADLFGILFDTYNDDINAYGFFLTAAGTQIDARYSSEGQDFDWNAVWLSSVKITREGWVVEIKIPYSALRFSAKDEQTWGFNIIRKIRRTREMSFWNFVDPKIDAFVRQFGDLTNLKNIKPPVRLSFSPYVAGLFNHYPYNQPGIKNESFNFSGGMDLKYGLSDAFTLDMTLVPDFSQVQSDNQVLNLSPFEVQFQERRPFFTEGTELFNKGGLFYSRRVGGTPIGYNDVYSELKEGEKIIKNPSQTQLYNATKLSGRTEKKLGIGIFNSVSAETFATAQDSVGATRKILSSPLTNYNIVVLDQALKNNSYVTLINTNVTRDGHYYDANVTGASFAFNNKSNMYTIDGGGVMSQQFYTDSAKSLKGYNARLNFGKSGGNFTWAAYGNMNTNTYDPNDLGINFLNNNIDMGVAFSYNVYKPFWKLNNFFNSFSILYQRMYIPDAFANFGISGNHITTWTKKFLTCGIDYGLEPIITYDYYEPRIFGRYYTFPTNYRGGGFISSDYRKPFALDIRVNYRGFNENKRSTTNINVSPRLRVNNKLSFIYESSYEDRVDDIGFVNYDYFSDTITFGRRNLQTISNTLSGVYKFTNKMSLSVRGRHYWSRATYYGYYNLEKNGNLTQYAYQNSHDVNFNAFNIDVVFFWQFAPGSELNIVYKNAVLKREAVINYDYYYNFKGSLNSPQNNSVSIKVLYYIDYLSIKKAFRKKNQN